MSIFRAALTGVLVSTAAVAFSSAARADFIVDLTPIGQNLNLSDTSKGISAGTIFTGTVNGYAGSLIDMTANVTVNTASGDASINAIKSGNSYPNPITELTFTPVSGTFNEFSFRGSLATNNVPETLYVTVTDTTNQTFDFEITSKGDFSQVGITAIPTNEIIKEVTITGYDPTGNNLATSSLADIKQVGFGYESVTPSVPEASTWAMMLMGFGSVGFLAYRRKSFTRAIRLV
jgi:PEP-CTERM motif